MNGFVTEVETLPACDFHLAYEYTVLQARYDGKTKTGKWAYMCEACFQQYGLGLGLGLGQMLVLHTEMTK